MNRNSGNRNATAAPRGKTLATAIVTALALGAVGSVGAAPLTNYTLNAAASPTPWTQTLQLVNFLHSITNRQTLNAAVSGTITGASVADTYNGSGSPLPVTNNTLASTAIGNQAQPALHSTDPAGNYIDLGLLGASGVNSGLGILSGQMDNGNAVNASVNGGMMSLALTNFNAGNSTVTGNVIQSSDAVNSASSQISGQLPANGFAGSKSGTSTMGITPATTPADTSAITGDLAVANAQVSANNTSAAKVANSHVVTSDTTNGTVTAQFTNSNNGISAGFTGNGSANAIAAQPGGAVSYQGSAAVSNDQFNDTAFGSANITGSDITTVVDNGTPGTGGSFNGTVTQSGNSINASAQGSAAANSIAFADGTDLSGDGVAPRLDIVHTLNSGKVADSAGGDLTLLNAQSNYKSGFSSRVANGDVLVTVNNAGTLAAPASISVGDNSVQSSAGGNSAGNSVTAHSGNSFTDGVAVGNQQSNYAPNASGFVAISASETGAMIGAAMAAANRTSAGSVTVSGNDAGASASGNVANTSVDVSSGNLFDSGANTGSPAAMSKGYEVQSLAAGVSVGNMQMNEHTTVAATASNNGINATYADGVVGGSSTVSNNFASASAIGNDAVTSASLGGANANTSAALMSFQDSTYVAAPALAASATASNNSIGSSVNGNTTAAMAVSGNGISASAGANRAVNSLSTAFGNATLGASAWSGYTSSIHDNKNYINQGNAALGLYSDQVTGGNIAATANGDQVSSTTTGNLGSATTPTSLAVTDNSIGAGAILNQATNTLTPGVGNLSTDTGNAAQIAALGNFQFTSSSASEDGNATVTINNNTAGAPGAIFAEVGGNATDAPVTTSDNQVGGFAAGNVASNSMAVTGADYAPAAVAGGAGNHANGATTDHIDTTLAVNPGFQSASANAAYALQNVQTSRQAAQSGTRSVILTNDSIGTEVAGNVTASPLTVSGNSVSSDARDNSAGNTLSLTGFSTLDTTAAEQNVQYSLSALTSRITNTAIGTEVAGNVTGSAVSVSGDLLSSLALGNLGINALDVSSNQLAGNSTAAQVVNTTMRGAATTPAGDPLVNADYGLLNNQLRTGAITVAINGGSTAGGGLAGSDIDGNVQGGSLTVTGNKVLAQGQSNEAQNGVALSGTSIAASAALLNQQAVNAASNVATSIGSTYGFAAYVGGALGTTTATPATVSGNSMTAQSGLNQAVNSLSASGSGSIGSTNGTYAGATNDTTAASGFIGAAADYSLYSSQNALSGASASVKPGISGIDVLGNVGNGNAQSALTVSDNSFAAQASANSASNDASLSGASSITASVAVNNTQSASGGAVAATTSGAQVGVITGGGNGPLPSVTNAALTVSGNALNANASGNGASNSIENLPVALNAGNPEATSSGVLNTGSSAVASNALLNAQTNSDAISSTVSGSSIGVNAAALTASPLIGSVATVGNNVASAVASGNSAGNSIELANLSAGVGSSALVSNQVNSANISATVSNTQIGVNAGATSTSPVTVSGNTISATAIGNSVGNHISVGH